MLLSDGMRCITAAGLACPAAVKDPLRCLPRAGAAAWGLDDAKGALPSSCPSLPTMFPFPFGALPSQCPLLAIEPPFAPKAVPSLWYDRRAWGTYNPNTGWTDAPLPYACAAAAEEVCAAGL